MASLTTATRPAIHQWNRDSNTPRPYDFAPGDIVAFTDMIKYGAISVGEITDIGANGRGGLHLHVHILERELTGSKIWHFNELTCNRVVQLEDVTRHVSHDPALGELTKARVRDGWRQAGFVVGCEKYCLVIHENEVNLDMAPGDSDDEDEEYVPGIHPEMADFIVPDEEGEAFCKPDPGNLTEEQRKWVNETHAAVREWESWVPKDQSQQAIKSFVDNMAGKYGHAEADRQFTAGAPSSSFTSPSDI
jgi:hypothetical protein